MSQRIPRLKPKEVVSALKRAGFYIHHQVGGHIQLRHELKHHLRVTVPFHSDFDLPPSLVASILRQSELSREEFLKII